MSLPALAQPADRFTFAADEILKMATLDAIEIPLWEVFEVPGPAVPAGGQPGE